VTRKGRGERLTRTTAGRAPNTFPGKDVMLKEPAGPGREEQGKEKKKKKGGISDIGTRVSSLDTLQKGGNWNAAMGLGSEEGQEF